MTDPCSWNITRRKFLTGLGAATAVVGIGAYQVGFWRNGDETASGSAPLPETAGSPHPGRTLVIVELGGGNDGFNTVVPHADPAYFDLRPDLAIAQPIDLDGTVGLHPSLANLAARYQAGRLAIVEGIGYPEPDLSHFASMATWWSAAPGDTTGSGWLGRYLDGTVGMTDPLAGVVIGPGPSRAMLGDASFTVSIQGTDGLHPRVAPWIDTPAELVSSWAGFVPASVDSPELIDRIGRAVSVTADAAARLNEALVAPGDSDPATGDAPAAGRRRNGSLTADLAVAARLVLSEAAPRVIYIHGRTDADTHENQLSRQAGYLTDLDEGIEGFFTDLDAAGQGHRALVVTTSEFGRRPRQTSSGSDHGTAAPHFVVGPSVVGGRFGEPVSLTALDRAGNPNHTVDFRTLYATLLSRWLEADDEMILDGRFESLPLLAG